MKDFLREGSIIPLATFRDYVQCFLTCLEAAPSSTGFSRELTSSTTTSAALELRLTLKLRALNTTWSPTYTFVLLPVPRAITDRLESQADEIIQLHKKVGELSARLATSSVYTRGNLVKVKEDDALVWKRVETSYDDLVAFDEGGNIRFKGGGLFVVHGLLNFPCDCDSGVVIVRNKVLVWSLTGGNAPSYSETGMFTLLHMLTVQPGGQIRIVNRAKYPVATPSTITIYKIG